MCDQHGDLQIIGRRDYDGDDDSEHCEGDVESEFRWNKNEMFNKGE